METKAVMKMSNRLYDIVLIDYPYQYWAYSDKGEERAPESHYDTMELDPFTEIMRRLVQITSKRAVYLLWVTATHKALLFNKINQWQHDPTIGLMYKTTAFTWVKPANRKQVSTSSFLYPPVETERFWRMNLGHYTRQNPEEMLLLRRNKFETLPRHDKGVSSIICQAQGRHSRKPNIQYERIMRLWGDVPRLELFARPPFETGWDVMGNEVDGKDIMVSLDEKVEEYE